MRFSRPAHSVLSMSFLHFRPLLLHYLSNSCCIGEFCLFLRFLLLLRQRFKWTLFSRSRVCCLSVFTDLLHNLRNAVSLNTTQMPTCLVAKTSSSSHYSLDLPTLWQWRLGNHPFLKNALLVINHRRWAARTLIFERVTSGHAMWKKYWICTCFFKPRQE